MKDPEKNMDAGQIDVRQLASSQERRVVDGQGYFPVIAHLGAEELVVALRGGAPHIGLAGRLDCVRSTDGGHTWSAAITIADSERDDRNPALGVTADGSLVLAYYWQGNYDADGVWKRDDSGPTDTRVVRSGDGGRSWVDDRILDFAPLNGQSPFGKIRSDSEGVMYMPIYGGPPEAAAADRIVHNGTATCPLFLLRSKDNGASWGDPLSVALGLNEADLLMLSDDEWLLAARSDSKGELGAIFTCRSNDRGRSWGELQQVTAAQEHPPDLTLLGDGSVLLNYGRRHSPFGVEGRVSLDGGRTWAAPVLQLATSLAGFDIGYPSTARLDDGRLVTVYYAAEQHEQRYDTPVEVYCTALCYQENELLQAVTS